MGLVIAAVSLLSAQAATPHECAADESSLLQVKIQHFAADSSKVEWQENATARKVLRRGSMMETMEAKEKQATKRKQAANEEKKEKQVTKTKQEKQATKAKQAT